MKTLEVRVSSAVSDPATPSPSDVSNSTGSVDCIPSFTACNPSGAVDAWSLSVTASSLSSLEESLLLLLFLLLLFELRFVVLLSAVEVVLDLYTKGSLPVTAESFTLHHEG